MDRWTTLIQEALDLTPGTQQKLLLSLAIIVVLWAIRWLVLRAIDRHTEDATTRYHARKTTAYTISVVGLLLLGAVWLAALRQIGTFLGLLSAGLAIALKDLVSDLAGWLFIVTRRPLQVGDRIEVGPHRGDIVDVRLFKFTLMEIGNWVAADQSTGRVIHVPNSLILREAFANYAQGFQYIWVEMPVVVTFESDWVKAKRILQETANRHAEVFSSDAEAQVRRAASRYLIVYTKLTPTVYTSVVDFGVRLTVRFLCQPRRRRGVEEAVWEDILKAFHAEPDIDFAYPTTRFYDHRSEGKPALRPPAD